MKSFRTIYLRSLIVLLLLCFTASPYSSAKPKEALNEFEIAKPGYWYRFPQDHSAHPQFQTEWWYYTGNLHSKRKNKQFGYQLTFFRVGIKPNKEPIYFAHFALTDVKAKKLYFFERINRPLLSLAGAQEGKIWNKNWSADIQGNGETHHLKAQADGMKIDLSLFTKTGPVIQGLPGEGISRKGPCESCASHYYSYPLLETNGSLTVNGDEYKVSGNSWMDHEFGSSQLQANQQGWDWFSIQFTDGSSLMLYQIREDKGQISAFSNGTYVSREGKVTHLERADFKLQATKFWASPESKITYPLVWEVTVPQLDIGVKVIPKVLDQEIKSKQSTRVNYWEGAIGVIDRSRGKKVGDGYLELTGYDKSLRGKL